MTRLRAALLISALGLGVTGCLVRGQASTQVTASSDPMLAEVDPGVWVVEDYDEPVFYNDGFYWLYRDDGWFRSSSYRGGWVYVRSAPPAVSRIERPRAYVRYRSPPGHRARRGPSGTVVIRNDRDERRDDWRNERRDERRDDRRDDRTPPPRTDPRPDRRPDDRMRRPDNTQPRPDDKADRDKGKGDRDKGKDDDRKDDDRKNRPHDKQHDPDHH